jgi:hypothetical protein
MARCKVVEVNGETVGVFDFDTIPRADELFVIPGGRRFKVDYVEHLLDGSDPIVLLTVWNFS